MLVLQKKMIHIKVKCFIQLMHTKKCLRIRELPSASGLEVYIEKIEAMCPGNLVQKTVFMFNLAKFMVGSFSCFHSFAWVHGCDPISIIVFSRAVCANYCL